MLALEFLLHGLRCAAKLMLNHTLLRSRVTRNTASNWQHCALHWCC